MRRAPVLLPLLLLLLASAIHGQQLRYNPDLLVYTADAEGFPAARVKSVFDRALAGSKPVILFVHGRGDEPNKSLVGGELVEGMAVSKLEAYDATVVLFSWDSKRGGFGPIGIFDRDRPLRNAPEGARRLRTVLDAFTASLAEHPHHPRVTLLVHSIGNVVLQRYVEQQNGWPTPGGRPLFDNVVLSSSDADNEGHVRWVDRIAQVERVFITENPIDGVLLRAGDGRPRRIKPLGLDPGPSRSSRARYVPLRFVNHEVFTRSEERPRVRNFFADVFAGVAEPRLP